MHTDDVTSMSVNMASRESMRAVVNKFVSNTKGLSAIINGWGKGPMYATDRRQKNRQTSDKSIA